MENNFADTANSKSGNDIKQRRRERDKLFAALERKLNRILAVTDTKGIIGQSAITPPSDVNERLAVLGAGRTITADQQKLADMAIHGGQGCRKNSRRRRMGL